MQKMKKCFIVVAMCLSLIMLKEATVFPHSADASSTNSGLDSFLEDRFLERIKTLEVASYALAEDFPREHIKTFNDFLLFYTSVEQTRRFSRSPVTSLVKKRLELNNPVRFKDFLAAVPLSVSFVGHHGVRQMFEWERLLVEHYVQMFLYPFRNTFLVENILEPLSHDLRYGEYRGFRFRNKDLPQFFREFADHCYDRRMEMFGSFPTGGLPFFTIRIPEEIILANYYAQTFLLIHNGNLCEAYREMYRYNGMYRNDGQIFILEEHQLLPPRPYYFYSDEDRYLWFKFLQAELRSVRHTDFADEILEIEIEHYRELINWQLQLRAYLTQKLYEYGDNVNLSTLKELLTAEYIELKNNPLFQHNFEMTIEILHDIDYKVRGVSPFDSTKGNLILPWIDREAIDYRQGIRSETISVYPEPITWKRAMENIDDETRKEMRNLYERSIYCIRVLAVISERLYLEKDLTTMVQLHSRLMSNRSVSFTPTGRRHFDLRHFFGILKRQFGDGANFLGLSVQTKLDLRRYDLIANDFWGHQARRRNGDMSVGDIILPWVGVRVWDEVP